MPPKDDPETAALKAEVNGMIEKFQVNQIVVILSFGQVTYKSQNSLRLNDAKQEDQKKQQDCTLQEKCADMADIPKIRFAPKKVLKGHINKVNSVHFAADSR